MNIPLKENEPYKIIDNFLFKSDYENVWNYTQNTSYLQGEVDHPDAEPAGMVSDLTTDNFLTSSIFPQEINNLPLARVYINLFAPRELACFHYDHFDKRAITLLYYPGPTYHPDEGGATELMIDDNLVGISPKTNRLLIFKANILHRATPYRSYPRYTYALKYDPSI